MLVLNALMMDAIKKYVYRIGLSIIKSTCDHRLVQCPAIEYKVTGTPNYVLTHSIQCPFYTVWWSGCKINWTLLATKHNCETK